EGSLVSYSEKTYRVTKCDRSGMVTLKSLEIEHYFDVPFTDVVLVMEDASREEFFLSKKMLWLERSEASPTELVQATARAEVISLYLDNNSKLSRQQAEKKLGVSPSTFSRLLRKYDPELGAVSLVGNVRGRKKGSRLLADIQEEIIQQAISARMKNKKKLSSFNELYDYIDSRCNVLGVRTPSYGTVHSRLNSFGVRAVYSLMHGREQMAQKLDLKPGMVDVETILSMVQVDHTRVDLIICDNEGRPLMRPWLTVVIDLKSRVVLGYYLALHPPSTTSVAMALLSACFPKHQLPITLGGGDSTRHRFWGKPLVVGTDNAAEFINAAMQAALRFYGMEPLLRPIGKKHFGGHVERLIGTLMGKVHMLPGTTYSNVLSKADYDSVENSAITFPAFCKWFADQIAIYHGRAHDGLGRLAPYEVWDAEMAKKGADFVPPMSGDFKTFALDFFPSVQRTVQTLGVEFCRGFYSSDVLYGLVGQRLTFKYNPLNISKIWLRIDTRYYELPCTNINAPVLSYSEYWAFHRRRKRRPGQLVDHELHQVRLDSYADIDNAVSDTKTARKQVAVKNSLAETMDVISFSLSETGVKPLAPDQTRKKLKW
ncbi:transposase, partial [Pseudomonas sp. NZIPFR-PS5]